MAIRRISTSGYHHVDHSGFRSPAALVGAGQTFVAGLSGAEFDPSESDALVEGDLVDQARAAYARIGRVLGESRLSLENVARVVEYVVASDITHYSAVEKVRSEVFGTYRPAINTVVVHRLFQPKALIELEATAARETTEVDTSQEGRTGFAAARIAEGLVYLPTVHPYNDDGELVGEGDVEAQARQIFRNAESILAACGVSMANVVSTLEMVRPEARSSYKYTGRVRRDFLGPVYPTAAGLLQDRVAPDDRVLLSYDFTASVHDPIVVNPGFERYSKLTYSPGVQAGNTVFLSGQAAMDPVTERSMHTGDVVAQTKYIYRNLITVLEAAGLGAQHLVRTVEFVTPEGAPRYRSTASIRPEILLKPYPASTSVLCHSLLRPEFEIEVVSTAVSA